MRNLTNFLLLGSMSVFFQATAASADQAAGVFSVTPADVRLKGEYDRIQLVVTEGVPDPRQADRARDGTHRAAYRILDPAIATVDAKGRVLALGNGTTRLEITLDQQSVEVPVTVEEVGATPLEFAKDIRPVLNKAGCASAACHAAQYGKGGFKLSVFGYDSKADHQAITLASRGRRLDFSDPESSLFLAKPSMQVAHGGGKRIEVGSTEYRIIRDWIRGGAPQPAKDELAIKQLEVFPTQRIASVGEPQQLRVIAHYADGSQRDVTLLALYDSLDAGVVSVTPEGEVSVSGTGQTSVMIRYDGQAAVSTFMIPLSTEVALEGWTNHNYIDEYVSAKFRDLGLEPSPVCDDATFIRRAYLDALGALPSPETVKNFIESQDPDKRQQLIDQLLGLTGDPSLDIHNDQFAAFWTLKWSDLIRNNSKTVGEQGMWSMHHWIKTAFRENRPFDEMVRELITAKGSIYSEGPANYFRLNADATSLTESTAQIFLGIRLECAKCHHHPFEKYSQADYYGMAAFFARVGTKNSEDFGLFGRDMVVMVKSSGDVSHPRTGQKMPPTLLDGRVTDHPLDRRIPLAEWLTSSTNDAFAKSVVNRYVGYLLGRGLVEPIDDMRSTNPPSNIPLLDRMTQDFIEQGYDLRRLMRTIMTSRVYSLSSQPTPENAHDRRFFSHFAVKRLTAEALLDAIDQATGTQTKFTNLPLGTKAVELPDAEYAHYFLTTFAKPRRASVCECERSPDANLSQALHTINGDTLAAKIGDKNGRVAKLIADKRSADEIIRELYLAALCRYPTPDEVEAGRTLLDESPTILEGAQDLLWALINSKQFLFVR